MWALAASLVKLTRISISWAISILIPTLLTCYRRGPARARILAVDGIQVSSRWKTSVNRTKRSHIRASLWIHWAHKAQIALTSFWLKIMTALRKAKSLRMTTISSTVKVLRRHNIAPPTRLALNFLNREVSQITQALCSESVKQQ